MQIRRSIIATMHWVIMSTNDLLLKKHGRMKLFSSNSTFPSCCFMGKNAKELGFYTTAFYSQALTNIEKGNSIINRKSTP